MLTLEDCKNDWFRQRVEVALGVRQDARTAPLTRLYDLDQVAMIVLLCFFAGYKQENQVNHVLLEGINGLSKTRLASQVNAALLGPLLRAFYTLSGIDPYQRTAGSPDQTPADLLGADVLGGEKQNERKLVFQKGPILRRCLVYYADELNRSPPKTQSVLLEAMAEQQVTVNTLDARWQRKRIQRLPWFFLLGSQNPEFHEGTFPLPEAQLDRFMVKLNMPYTSRLADLLDPAGDPSTDAQRKRPSRQSGLSLEDAQTYFEELLKESWSRFATLLNRASNNRFSSVNPSVIAQVCRDYRMREKKKTSARTRRPTLEQIEYILHTIRQEELDKKKTEVAQNGIFSRTVADHTAQLVYATWSVDAARALVRGLENYLSPNPEIRALVADVAQGCSPRAAIALRDLSCALAWAQSEGETAFTVTEEHVDAVAPFVLQHRLTMRFQSMMAGGLNPEQLVERLVALFRWQRYGKEMSHRGNPHA